MGNRLLEIVPKALFYFDPVQKYITIWWGIFLLSYIAVPTLLPWGDTVLALFIEQEQKYNKLNP